MACLLLIRHFRQVSATTVGADRWPKFTKIWRRSSTPTPSTTITNHHQPPPTIPDSDRHHSSAPIMISLSQLSSWHLPAKGSLFARFANLRWSSCSSPPASEALHCTAPQTDITAGPSLIRSNGRPSQSTIDIDTAYPVRVAHNRYLCEADPACKLAPVF